MNNEKNNWRLWPTEPGWWWCRPSIESAWFESYPDGCVVEVRYDDGWRDSIHHPDLQGLYATGILHERKIGIDRNKPEDLFGTWEGPMKCPIKSEQELVIDAEFVVLSERKATADKQK